VSGFPGMQIEPVLVTQLISAVLALAVAFGAPITEDQRNAVLAVTAACVAIFFGGGLPTRQERRSFMPTKPFPPSKGSTKCPNCGGKMVAGKCSKCDKKGK
jgi:hypothetical protein